MGQSFDSLVAGHHLVAGTWPGALHGMAESMTSWQLGHVAVLQHPA